MARLNEVLNYNSQYTNEKGVLENNLNIDDPIELERVERLMTGFKLANLYLNPGKQSFDVDHYLGIHKYLFEDIYPFAGQIRSENINKRIPFCLPNFIHENLVNTLKKARIMAERITNEEELMNFITYFYSELDIIHPFREGNGRTEREFLRQYVEKINETISFGTYYLDYNQIENREDFINAIIIADATCDLTYLKEFIRKILVNSNKKIK